MRGGQVMRNFRYAVSTGGFWIGAGIMLLTFLGLSMPEWAASRDWGVIGQPSALQLSLLPIFFGGVQLLFPFCVCTAYAAQQVDEIRSGFMGLRLIRSNRFRYALRQLITNFMVGGLCVSGAFLLHAALCHLMALPSMPEVYESHEIPFSEGCIYAPWLSVLHGLPILLWIAAAMALTGGVWATSGLAVSVWIPDRWMIVSLPVFLYYVLNSRTVYMLTGLRIPYAADLYNDALTVPMVISSLKYDALLLMLFALVYVMGLKRRVAHG